uniref:Uncharacterized protein n=1 Tax=Zooxanthella nutricula TaxID=1333877 RepID=A0A6U6GK10_9DINO
MMLLCVAFAVLAGLTYTASVLVLALPDHFAHLHGTEVGARCHMFLMACYVALNVGSVLPLMLSTHNGPVAVTVPVMLASQLLSNMVIQAMAGSSHYSKAMRSGTYVLAIAALELIDVGPSVPEHPSSPLTVVTRPVSVAWLAAMVGCIVVGLLMLPCVHDKSRDNGLKLLAYTAIVSNAAALNNSLSKVVTSATGLTRVATMAGYLLFGATSTLASSFGYAGLNNAVCVPVFTCMQVVVNGLTGLVVWGDAEHLDDPIAYACVYVLILLGIYLCSSIEIGIVRKYVQRKNLANPKSKEYRAIQELYDAMGKFQDAQKLMVANRKAELSERRSSRTLDAEMAQPSAMSRRMSRAFASLRALGLPSARDVAGAPLTDALGTFLGTAAETHGMAPPELRSLCMELARTLEKHGDDGAYVLQGAVARWAEDGCEVIHQFRSQDPSVHQSLVLAAKLQPN